MTHLFRAIAFALLCSLGFAAACAAEFRGLWVDAFHPGFRTADEIRQLVADARTGHFNALLVEVRKRGDAYYDSRLEPKASDVDPAFDPLAELLTQAHDTQAGPRLEVHAWVVAFNIWNSEATLPPQPEHPYRRHPDWLTQSYEGARWDGANYAFDPGHPAVQEHTYQVAMDLISRYDVDGLHWDYVRYGGRQWGYNPVAVARFNEATGGVGSPAIDNAAWLQWRRDQVTSLVRRVYLSALALKPTVKLSAATITWTPSPTNVVQWFTSAPFARVLQDWRSWMQEGILDLNIPMAYFRQEQNASDWRNWSAFAKDQRANRHLALGVGAYLNGLSNSLAQIESTRSGTAASPPAEGVACYSYAALGRNKLPRGEFLAALAQAPSSDTNVSPVFASLAEPPSTPWKTIERPTALMGSVRDAQTGKAISGATITIQDADTPALRSDANGFYGGFVSLDGQRTVVAAARDYLDEVRPLGLCSREVTVADFALSRATAEPTPSSLLSTTATNNPSLWWPRHRPTAGQPLRRLGPDDGAGGQPDTNDAGASKVTNAP